ncbi:MAG: glyoxalase [Nitrososphaera sp.]
MRFYKGVFGWKFDKWHGPMDYWMATTGSDSEPGINGGISRRDPKTGMPNMNTIGVNSVDKFSKKVKDGGGKVLVPKMSIPDIGWFATCQDTEGSVFGIMESDPQAR